MSYPEDALAPHETLVLNLHPHWWYIAKSGIVLVVSMALGIYVAFAVDGDSSVKGPLQIALALAILVSLGWFLVRLIQWVSINFVLTSDRVMFREGVLSKRGIEIPLERINTVLFNQSIMERILGLGDLEIESASKDGSQQFEDIRRPSDVQKEIYIQVESNENRKFDRIGQNTQAAADAAQAARAPSGGSIADQVQQLAQLRDLGHLTEAEFQAKKADLLNRM